MMMMICKLAWVYWISLCGCSTAEWSEQKCHSDLPYICKRVNVTGTAPPTPSSPHLPSGCPEGWSSYRRKVRWFCTYLPTCSGGFSTKIPYNGALHTHGSARWFHLFAVLPIRGFILMFCWEGGAKPPFLKYILKKTFFCGKPLLALCLCLLNNSWG